MEERKNKIIELQKKGLSLRQIGKIFNISGERVRQIIKYKDFVYKKRVISNMEKYLMSVKKTTSRDRAREMVRLRDNHTCKDCGFQLFTKDILKYNSKIKTKKGKKKSLDVHHINGECGKNSTGYDSPKIISGMITLCHKCHFNRPEHKCKKKEWSSKISNGWKNSVNYK